MEKTLSNLFTVKNGFKFGLGLALARWLIRFGDAFLFACLKKSLPHIEKKTKK